MLTLEEREIAVRAVALAVANVNQPRASNRLPLWLQRILNNAVNGVSFQGRSTAVVNVGTPITAILNHLAQNAPALRQEIPV